ncbi:MAG: protein-glutamate O-methyltransferase CheR [Clostridiales Family XIII bacterium]|jgi:chemotaxis protein methyltransferase CheR|nr:protein-glutamate O-methyltransferase CheR [Clostridiales Family XIII bacterium]
MIVLSDHEFKQIADYVKQYFGVNLSRKRTLIEGRLGFYITSKGYTSYQDYLDYAINDSSKKELANMISRLTTNHTYFMREQDHFEFYRDHVLPWIEHELDSKDLWVWSAGCSSGQEPYTLSIFTLEYTSGQLGWDTSILASDVADEALMVAKRGIYPKEELSKLSEVISDSHFKKYFSKVDDETYKVTDLLRSNVSFINFNLLAPYNFKKQLHVIFCRNVMIYFDTDTKTEIINKMYDCLLPGGYLFIGHSESLSTLKHNFKYIMPSIYRKPLD